MTHPTNALAEASSSYLRSAMHQPVQWHEWGAEAFARASNAIRERLLSQSCLQSDETSVRVGKKTWWTWVFHHAGLFVLLGIHEVHGGCQRGILP